MNIYVVRWMSRIDSEECSGTFEMCYSSEEEAKDALVQDFEDCETIDGCVNTWNGSFWLDSDAGNDSSLVS